MPISHARPPLGRPSNRPRRYATSRSSAECRGGRPSGHHQRESTGTPVIAKNKSFSEWSGKKRLYLVALAKGFGWLKACDQVGIDRTTTWDWRNSNPAYAAACEKARDLALDALEESLEECSKKAERDPRYQQSLTFALKARRRHVYGDHVVQEVTTNDITGDAAEASAASAPELPAPPPSCEP